jgi:signal transduction histidine kinase
MIDSDRGTILVVDDSPDDIAIISEVLKIDYRVQAATDPEAAARLARASPPPDLILLDVMMPGTDGYQLCRELKSDPVARSIPVIFVTSKGAPESEAEGFEAGGVDYISKPVNPQLVRARVRTQVELKAARDELERKNEILRENARLREEVEAINRHDLRNPLMVIMTVPGLLLESENLTEDQRGLVRHVDNAGRTMLEMINRTVDLFKMEQGTYVAHAVPVNALQLIEQFLSALQSLITEKGLIVDVRVCGAHPAPGDTFLILGEQLLVFSMLANLIKNAAEASPAGGTISISLCDNAGGQDAFAEISIHNGGTIPAAIRERFFQKFATAGKKRGTGIGAYSARLMARTLGGDIRFESSEEKGTTITVRLPMA